MEQDELFHINRIISTLLNQQTPNNDHGEDGISIGDNFIDKTREEKLKTIIDSLYELELISENEYVSFKKVLDFTLANIGKEIIKMEIDGEKYICCKVEDEWAWKRN